MKSIHSLAGKDLKKNGGVAIRIPAVAFGLVFLGICLLLVGCGPYAGLGETSAERGLRHKRVFRVNLGEMYEDIDRVLMLDRPSGLTENRLP